MSRWCQETFKLVFCLFMVFSAAFNNISVISWRSVLLEETGVHGESHRSVFSGVRVTRSLVFHVCFNCRSLFVLLYFFFWSWCCLFFFDIRILITSLWYLQTVLTDKLITYCIEYSSPWTGFELTNCTGSCKSNYHTMTTMMAPLSN